MRFKFLIAAFAMMAAYLCPSAEAKPIAYTLTGTMSGTLGETSFTDAAFGWLIVGDTNSLRPLRLGLFAVPATSQSLAIAGIGPVTPSVSFFAGVRPAADLFYFTNLNADLGLVVKAPAFGTYDGISPLGPTSVLFNDTNTIPSDQGDLFITSATNLVFQALTASDVPEPITLTLFGAGLGGIGALRRRHKALT